MLPKSSKHFIVWTAENLNVDSQFVEDVIRYYYSRIRKTLSSLESPIVRIEHLGSFKVKTKELPKLYNKYKKHLSVLKTDTFSQMSIKKDIESKLVEVIELQDIIMDEYRRKKEFKIRKDEYIRKNMESKKTDSWRC